MRWQRIVRPAGLFLIGSAAGLAGAAPPAGAGRSAATTGSTVLGPCPDQQDGGEIVVCGRRSPGDRYRIPGDLRDERRPPTQRAWGSRVDAAGDIGRAERPGSNSPVGSGGQTGQRQQMLREWGEVCPKINGVRRCRYE